ncbi:MAG: M20/M25/M40 family metallo-hydrolase [Eubacteriaceae bacterium]|nr:M20/M25/M40 family metallo-hydrolase [Eubacteriaceae bacterium]
MDETVRLLTELINFDTGASGTEAGDCRDWIAKELSSERVRVRTYETASSGGRDGFHLLAEVPGSSPSSLLLHAHLDTAPFGPREQWPFPPDRASVIRGCVCGRGALDCKGPLAVWMRLIKDAADAELPFSLKLLVTDLEETGGEDGAGKLLNDYPDILDSVSLAVGEGGGYPFVFGGRTFYTFQTGEREDDASGISGKACSREEVIRILSAGIEKGYYGSEILAYAEGYDTLTGRRMELAPLYEGMEEFFGSAPQSSLYTAFGDVFGRALAREVSGAELMGCITPGFSDNRFLRRAGIPTAGFFPLDLENPLRGIHGPGEYISLSSLRTAYRVMSRVIADAALPELLCGGEPGRADSTLRR